MRRCYGCGTTVAYIECRHSRHVPRVERLVEVAGSEEGELQSRGPQKRTVMERASVAYERDRRVIMRRDTWTEEMEHTESDVTCETFHALMSSLKNAQAGLQSVHVRTGRELQKSFERSVTLDTSHCPIGP